MDPFDSVWIIKSKTLRARHNVRVRLYQDLLSAGWEVSEFVTSFSNYVIIELGEAHRAPLKLDWSEGQ
jgi:hypothetical protein